MRASVSGVLGGLNALKNLGRQVPKLASGPTAQQGKTANEGETVPPTAKRISMSLGSYAPATRK
jgi:hypothetical protein